MRMFVSALAGAAIFATCPDVRAEGVHIGGGYTLLEADPVEFDALTFRAGYDFTDYLGLEGEVLVGLGSEDEPPFEISLNYGLGAFGKVQYPISDIFFVFGRVGYVYQDGKAEAFGITLSEDGDGIAYGGGAEVMFADRHGLRADYTRYDMDGGDGNGYALSYIFRLQSSQN